MHRDARTGARHGLPGRLGGVAAALLVAALTLASGPAATAAGDVGLLDLVELDYGYTTLTDHYYRDITPQRILDGARDGMVAYLHSRGIADPHVPYLRARPDGRGVVPAIERQLGAAVTRYGSRVEPREFVYAVIRGELEVLHDPYSVLFTKGELSAFSAALDGRSFGGIGLVVARDAPGIDRVDDVFADGPAARAGITAGDRIVAIDGAATASLDGAALGEKLRGPVGSHVRVRIVRADGNSADLDLRRAAVTPPDVRSRLLPGDIGYVSLRTFGPDAARQVRAALERLHTRGAKAIVFDLRGNGGGYESSAIGTASAFIASGPIVITQTNHGERRVTNAEGSALAPLPLVVLVDGDSASGSELVTGAIRDHGAGRIVGTRTFGKGLVQTIYPMPDGSALKVTTARYFTPDGHDIDRVGITPDIVVPEPPDAVRGEPGHDPQLDAALALLAPPTP